MYYYRHLFVLIMILCSTHTLAEEREKTCAELHDNIGSYMYSHSVDIGNGMHECFEKPKEGKGNPIKFSVSYAPVQDEPEDSEEDSAQSAPTNNNDAEPPAYTGGAHEKTKTPPNDGKDSHHCPAKKSYSDAPISTEKGPAIKMEPADHKKTASNGSSDEAKQYRQQQRDLLNQGRLMDAIQMDIDDIRSKFKNKYDTAIEEMLAYAKTLDPECFKS